jgi:RND family efflux transporter MFP subunit
MSPDRPDRARRPRTIGIVLAIVAVAVVAGGFATRAHDARELRARAAAQALPTVAVVTPTLSEAASTLELPGRIEAYARAPIHARVDGYVKSWHADIGARVEAGQLLAVIETPDLDQQLLQARAELANARANADLAETTAKRWQSLLEIDSVSRQEAEEKNGDLAAKRSAVRALEANVERFEALKQFTRITAPFDGVVTARATDVGALVTAGAGQDEPLFVVSDTSKARIYVNVPQNFTAAIQPGTEAIVTVPERPERQYRASVQSSAQAIDVASGTMLVQLRADNAASELLPGEFARVAFTLPKPAAALTVPSSALIVGKEGLRVATLTPEDKVRLKQVTLARDMGATIDVAAGLEAADRVIENPPDGLADGDRVHIASPVAAAGAPRAHP